jgi:hypothetical protein
MFFHKILFFFRHFTKPGDFVFSKTSNQIQDSGYILKILKNITNIRPYQYNISE